jgi:magnesium-transporting ATPase (P-type)
MGSNYRKFPQYGWVWLSLIVAACTTLIGLLLLRRYRSKQQPVPLPEAFDPPAMRQLQGLSEAEARKRFAVDPVVLQTEETRQARRKMWLSNTVSIFNISMVGLAIVQWLLDDSWWNIVFTLLVLAMSIGLNVFQESFAANRVGKLKQLTRPMATVVREGQIKSIDPVEIVVGDVLVVGPGDRFLADGELVGSEAVVVEQATSAKGPQMAPGQVGDHIQVGSTCIKGRAAYRVMVLPERLSAKLSLAGVLQRDDSLTTLQRLIDRILRIFLGMMGLFLIIFMIDVTGFLFLSVKMKELYREIASIIFSLAPSGLFFMIVVTYAMGSAALARTGALIRDSRTIESLSQVTTLCFGQTEALTGAQVTMKMVPNAPLAESRVRQLLGDLAHTLPPNSRQMRSLAQHFLGETRIVEQAIRLLSIYGWSGMTLTDVDARGTYIIGEPEQLRPYLAQMPEEMGRETEPKKESAWQAGLKSMGRFLRVNRQPNKDQNQTPAQPQPAKSDETSPPKQTMWGRLRTGITGLWRQPDSPALDQETPATSLPESRLLFAYRPDICPFLYDSEGYPSLPQGLIPLCELVFSEQIRAETAELVSTFTAQGVKIKILSSGPPERILTVARQLGLTTEDDASLNVVTGAGFGLMLTREQAHIAQTTTLFTAFTREQKGQVVQLLREQGEHVAMVGDTLNDLAAMDKAHLSITTRGSSQATLSTADIVLLQDSLDILPAVVQEGQKIVNGLLNILKINLTQISYLLLLIVAMIATGMRLFFYHPTQGSVVVFFTLIAPAIGLTLWAASGAIPGQKMNLQLARFVIPAALTIAAAVIGVSGLFFRATGNIDHTQLIVTYALITMGSLLVVFVQPPLKILSGGAELSGDWRPTVVVVGLFALFNVIVFIPLAQEYLRIFPLPGITDYLVVGGVTVMWGIVLLGVWRSRWFRAGVDWFTRRLISQIADRA